MCQWGRLSDVRRVADRGIRPGLDSYREEPAMLFFEGKTLSQMGDRVTTW